jgi:DNA (cytosine-5)-methyltransferase 1
MKVIDLFAGVGGFSQGFIKAGFDVVLAIEHDKEIARCYQHNHPSTTVIAEDIEKIEIEKLNPYFQDLDVVIGGPPCQGFSQKGKRLSILDERNFLFQYFNDVVRIAQPEFFILENVANIITTDNGFFKNEIIQAFSKIGYDVEAKVLNSANFGVPQIRKRAVFLGQKKKLAISIPLTNNKKTTIKEAIYDMPYLLSGEGLDFYKYQIKPQSEFQELMRKGSNGIHNHQATKHSKLALERLALIPKGKGRESLPKEHLTKSIHSGTWCRLLEDSQATTITTRFDTPSSGRFTHPTLNRCITVREAARIQSFSDSFIFTGTKNSQMKQVGNAVPPLMAFEIAKTLAHYIQHGESTKSS